MNCLNLTDFAILLWVAKSVLFSGYMTKAVIFDMDGVICHTNPFHSQAFKIFFEKRNIFPTEDEFHEHMYGKNNGYILSHFLGKEIKGQELDELEFEKESLFREIYQHHVEPIPGFMHFFQSLKDAGTDRRL